MRKSDQKIESLREITNFVFASVVILALMFPTAVGAQTPPGGGQDAVNANASISVGTESPRLPADQQQTELLERLRSLGLTNASPEQAAEIQERMASVSNEADWPLEVGRLKQRETIDQMILMMQSRGVNATLPPLDGEKIAAAAAQMKQLLESNFSGVPVTVPPPQEQLNNALQLFSQFMSANTNGGGLTPEQLATRMRQMLEAGVGTLAGPPLSPGGDVPSPPLPVPPQQ